ncbi:MULTISPECIES: diaminopimelate decarboxylase [unclassified Haladaptatus]|uniref:diaminopimelate decarboxylase n=1 Tax=unclassified Haladaptatus TaxID=2622732 RepID=UPI0023E8415C|nr:MULTISPECIES: diaminopimelate decarboxylase [unclassified Haladaptatus]
MNDESGGPDVRRLHEWDAGLLADLAAEYGSPLYVYDVDRVRENAWRIRGAFPDAEVSYATKANTSRPVLRALREEDVGAECASAGEVERSLAAGFTGNEVRYTAVNPPSEDLDHVCARAEEHPLTITIGAADTLDRLADRGFYGKLAVRVNPGVGAGHHAKVTTGTDPKFGVPYDDVPELLAEAADRGFDVVGIHAHAGSGISGDDLSSHRELVSRMGALARESPVALDFVNVGGGFGVPYREDEPPLDIDAVADATREALGEVDAQLAIEPGRYFVADAGVLLTNVNTVKQTPETLVVGVDAGMTTLVRPAMYDSYHAIRNLAPDAGERESVETLVAGPICETSDIFATDRVLPAPARGDLLCIGNAGAYGYEMASQYNSRPRPAVVALDDGEASLAIRRETLADVTTLEEP